MKGTNLRDVDACDGLSGPGVIALNTVETMKSTEAPEFYEGRLVKHRPARHCIPRYKYYFSSEEWFENTEVTRRERNQSRRPRRNSINECEKFNNENISQSHCPKNDCTKQKCLKNEPKTNSNDKLNTETSQKSLNCKNTINNSKSQEKSLSFEAEDSEEYKAHFNVDIPSKVYADTYIRKNAAKWKSTPVPGMLTCSEYDQYRNEAIQPYDRVYEKSRGVLPKYGGYVPGLKFRYGSPFGQLTYNARELGFTKSRTWGGAVSLF
jgi:superfamily II DNA helicase RecQ